MLVELIGGLFKAALIKLTNPVVLAVVCLVSVIVIMAMAILEMGKLIKGCYLFLRIKIAKR